MNFMTNTQVNNLLKTLRSKLERQQESVNLTELQIKHFESLPIEGLEKKGPTK